PSAETSLRREDAYGAIQSMGIGSPRVGVGTSRRPFHVIVARLDGSSSSSVLNTAGLHGAKLIYYIYDSEKPRIKCIDHSQSPERRRHSRKREGSEWRRAGPFAHPEVSAAADRGVLRLGARDDGPIRYTRPR